MARPSAKDERFVLEYLACLDPKQAALAAGFAPSMAGTKAYQWVSDSKAKPHVFAAIQAGFRKHAEGLGVTTDRVIAELAKIGFSDIRHVVNWRTGDVLGKDGEVVGQRTDLRLMDSDQIHADAAAAISEVSQTAHGVRVKLYDKRSALVDLGKFTGAFKDEGQAPQMVTFIVERHRDK